MIARYLENFDNKNIKYVKIYKQIGYDLMLQDAKELQNY